LLLFDRISIAVTADDNTETCDSWQGYKRNVTIDLKPVW
jgi:hypothetical protein